MKNTNISERLLQLIEYLGITPNEFGQNLGYKRSQAVYDMINGKSKPSFDFFEKFLNSEYSESASLEWVITGRGHINQILGKELPEVREPASVFKLRTDTVMDHQSIPLYNIEASAGIVTLFRDSKEFTPIDFIQIPNLPKCDGALYVTGDSMYPLLKSGDIIMYKQMHDLSQGIIWGEMYLVSVDYDGDEIVSVKWIKKSELGEEYIKLVSQNQHHQDRDVPLSRVKAMAIVKASIRINSMS